MTYNESFFDAALNKKLKDKLDKLILWQDQVVKYMMTYLVDTNGQEQLKGCDSFIHIVAKIRFNLEAATSLCNFLYSDYRFKTSVNVLYRTIIDDLINAYYLFCTVALGDPDQNALNNELNILHKEYIVSVLKGLESERKFEKILKTLKNEEIGEDEDYLDQFRKENADLFNNEGIRKTTNPFFTNLFNQNDGNAKSFISEAKKLEFIAARNVGTESNIAAMYKYLSQYQHYSPKMRDYIQHHIEYDIGIYQKSLGEVLILLNQLFQFIKFNNKTNLEAEWERLTPLVFNSFAE
jgi:hypothetical protein